MATLGLAFGLAQSAAHDLSKHSAGSAGADAEVDVGAVEIVLRDSRLVDQDGQSHRFKSDVIQDRIVVISFIYTSCTTICPVMSSILALAQDGIGPRLGQEVWFVSITVDPARDTPSRLKAYAAEVGARAGWIWLTGDKPDVADVLKGLDAYTPAPGDHAPALLIGDAGRGAWTRLYGFPGPEQIVAAVSHLIAARRPASGS